MNNIFSMDSKFIRFGTKLADLMLVNILTIICSLPIITIGASFTAMQYTVLKLSQNDESYVTKNFFNAFKNNFRQSTILWLVYLLIGIMIGIDFYMITQKLIETNPFFDITLCIISFLVIFSFNWVFILLSRYENTIIKTIINSFIFVFSHFGGSVIIVCLSLLPTLLVVFFPGTITIILLLGISTCAYMQTFCYYKIFKKWESH